MSAALKGRKSIIATVAVLGVAGAGLVATAGGAVAASGSKSYERHGSCGTARYEAEIDREDGGLESSFELEGAALREHRNGQWR